jgi:hypothetical protein
MDLRQFFCSQPDAHSTKKRVAADWVKGPLAKFFECSPRVLDADSGNNSDKDLRNFQSSPFKRLKNNESWAGVRTCDATPVATTNKRKSKSKKCKKCGKTRPSFGNPGDKPKDAKWCKKCKPETAVDVKNTKKCEKCGKAQPSYGNPGDKFKNAKWCAKCKPETAVNVISKMCEKCGKTQPSFGNPGDKPKDAKWCKKCKPKTAVDVANKKCKECGKAQPSYGNPGDKAKNAKWCAKCKPETAVNVRSKMCECGKIPSFGNPGDKPKDAKWCGECKPATAVDVVHKKCKCGKFSSFGNPGDKAKDAKWCADCKPETAVDVVSKRCISDHCETIIIDNGINNTGYCMGCFSHEFPESKLVRFVRCKELAVVRAIYERFAKHDFAQIMVNDRRIQGGCSKKRPDICIDLATHVLIVEVDEFQHLKGDYSCENKRMMELFEDGQRRPIIFLRFNPDKYTDAFGFTMPSPWTKTKGGEPRIHPKRKDDWRKRLNKLFARIKYWTQLSDFPTKEVSVEHLFYDA